jgi:uncharacterized protein YegL
MKTGVFFGLATVAFLFMGIFIGVPLDSAAEGDGYAYPEINYLNINATIDNNYAVTEISEELYNPYEYAIDDTFSFQIPPRAFISNFSLTIDGITYYAEVVSKDVGKQKYEEAKVSGKDAGLVESYGKSVFSYSISLSPNQTIVVGLKYEEFLEKTLGGYEYKLHLSSGSINSNTKNMEISVDINSELKITDASVPNYKDDSKINYVSSTEALVSYSTNQVKNTADFIVNYELEPVHINGKMLNYNDGETGFFTHVFSPQSKELGGTPMDKDIIFVLDKSGSMSGTKISQLKDAFDEIVHELREGDMFNIVMFNSGVTTYRSDLITASKDNQDAAAEFINGISSGGSTDINEALLTALDMFRDTAETVPIIVFLTDGLPTSGETNTFTIRDNIKKHNEESVAIFALGFGYDVDFEFLKALSLENSGHALRIEEGEDAKEQITNFYDTVSTPLLKNLKFEYIGDAYEIYPTEVDQLFEGTEVVIVGKYNLSIDELTCNVYTTSKDGERIFSQTFNLEQSTEHSFIPRLWAYTKINQLLDEITVIGEDETLVGEVVTLAMEYQFVTPYTSLLITTEEAKEEEKKEESSSEEEKDKDTSQQPPGSTSTYIDPAQDSDGDGIGDNYDYYPYNPDKNDTIVPSLDGDDQAEKEESELIGSGIGVLISVFAIIIIMIIVVIVIGIYISKRNE